MDMSNLFILCATCFGLGAARASFCVMGSGDRYLRPCAHRLIGVIKLLQCYPNFLHLRFA